MTSAGVNWQGVGFSHGNRWFLIGKPMYSAQDPLAIKAYYKNLSFCHYIYHLVTV